MKIALCLSGQPRSLEEGFLYHKRNILDPNRNVDVFVHTWNDQALVGKNYDCTAQEIDLKFHEEDSVLKVLKLYNPVSMKVEKPKNFLKENGYAKSHEGWDSSSEEAQAVRTNNSFSQFYSIFQANKLKQEHEVENRFVYDVEIRSRFDFAINVIINFNNLHIDKETLYVPDLNLGDEPHFNDQFALGHSKVMDKYSELYKDCSNFFNKSTQRFTKGNELMFFDSCTSKKVKLQGINVNHPFLPTNSRRGNSTPHSLIR
jgi:hypothetical protein